MNFFFSKPESGVGLVTELPELDNIGLLILCTYAPSGDHFVTGTTTGQIDVWDVSNGYSLLTTITDHVGILTDMVFSENGCYLATAAVDMTMRIFDVKNGYVLKAVFYAPINKLDFVTEDVLVVGEATGNKRLLKIQM